MATPTREVRIVHVVLIVGASRLFNTLSFSPFYTTTQGMRRTMEDRISVVGSFLDDDADYFGIFVCKKKA